MTNGIFEIEGRDYWDDPMKNTSSVLPKFVPEDRYGLFIDAPAEVNLRSFNRIPLLMLHAIKEQEARFYDPWDKGHLVCVRLEDRTLELDDLLDAPEVEGADDEGDSSSPPGTGAFAVTSTTNIMRMKALQRPGHCILTALVMDRTSNRIKIDVTRSSKSGYEDEAVPAFLQSFARRLPPPPAVRYLPGQSAATFTANPDSPQLPESPGIALRCERVVLYEQGKRGWVRGAIHVPVLHREIVPAVSENLPDNGGAEYGDPRPIAIVPVWLVIIGSEDGKAEVVFLRVPCFSETVPQEGETVTGYFEYDIFSRENVAGKAQTNFVYGFCGESMTGPELMAVVTADMLPS
jgi:hypothetical protein